MAAYSSDMPPRIVEQPDGSWELQSNSGTVIETYPQDTEMIHPYTWNEDVLDAIVAEIAAVNITTNEGIKDVLLLFVLRQDWVIET